MSKPTLRMSGIPVRKRSGRPAVLVVLIAVGLLGVAAGCNYTFQAGSGFPPHVRTVAVETFDNETDRFEVSQELYEQILEEIPRSFGLTSAGEEFADAIIRGSVRRYSVDAPSYRTGQDGNPQVVERQVVIGIEVQVIDRVNNVILWENNSLSERGEYLEASELEETGRELAIERLVRAIVNGLQSNW
ncbi:MAG: hypothetical protein EA351_14655 [Gemmatimonadales bacterium]|nr:MAG: hypothetical protein EA351_14655 [Gemmatimonadales bacterium]